MINWFSQVKWERALQFLSEFPMAIWETFYVTLLATAVAFVIGLPLGVLLVVGDKDGIHPMPRALLHAINVLINLLRSVPFLILIVMVIPLTQLILGTSVGTMASAIPLTIAAFPFAARLVESSLREVDPNLIEAAQSMGATPMQIVLKVLLPESVPSLISNVTLTLTTVLSYTAMSGTVGGGGLGKIALMNGYQGFNYYLIIFSVVCLILIVQLFQTVGTHLATRLDKRVKNK